jgi:hypothetical protein
MSEKMRDDFIAWIESLNVGYDTRFTDFIGGDGEFFDGEVQGLWACWQASRERAYTAIDMTTAAAEGFRDGVASRDAEVEDLRKQLALRHPFKPAQDGPTIGYTGCIICGAFTDHGGLQCPKLRAYSICNSAPNN